MPEARRGELPHRSVRSHQGLELPRLPADPDREARAEPVCRTTSSPRSSRRRSTRRHFVPGIGPSPDRMLQARLFGYGDAHRYRLGINHTQPGGERAEGVDGRRTQLRPRRLHVATAAGGGSKNYEPNSFDGPVQTNEALLQRLGCPSRRSRGTTRRCRARSSDFKQAGDLYRLQPKDAQQRLVDNNIVGESWSATARRHHRGCPLAHFRSCADAEFWLSDCRRGPRSFAASRSARNKCGCPLPGCELRRATAESQMS